MIVYVLNEVTYDWYRFEDTMAVFKSKESAHKYVAQSEYPMDIYDTPETSEEQDGREAQHYYLQTFEVL